MDLPPAIESARPATTNRARDALILIGRLSNAIVGHGVNAIVGETFDALRVRAISCPLPPEMLNQTATLVAGPIE